MIYFTIRSQEQSKKIMMELDSFTSEMNYHNIKFVDKKLNTKKEYLEHLGKSVLNFHESEIKKIHRFIELINERIIEIDLRINLNIGFIKTNGTDSFDLPYTRGNNVILPSKDGNILSRNLNLGLIIHEIFHILTRMNPEIRNELYKIVGFYKSPHTIITNQEPGMIINPDALTFDYYGKCFRDKQQINVLPLIMMSNDGKEMEWVKLMVLNSFLQKTNEIISVKETNYVELYSHASQYVSHPEEICAESFRNIFIKKNINELFLNTLKRIFIEKDTIARSNINNTDN
jgi:hypothetical protein